MPILKTSTEIRAERDRLLELANDPDPVIAMLSIDMGYALDWVLGTGHSPTRIVAAVPDARRRAAAAGQRQ
jgi:hypothetical protein